MSMESSDKPAKPVRRFGLGLMTFLQLASLAALLLALNYLAYGHHSTRDLSGDAAYTLSPSTVSYLTSPALQERKDPVTLIVAYRRNSPFYERLSGLADEYASKSHGKIKPELLDPVRSMDDSQRKIAEYGTLFKASAKQRSMFTHDLVIVDARTAEEKALPPGPARIDSYSHIRFLEPDSILQYGIDEKGTRKITGFSGESSITTALLSAVEGHPRKLYFLADRSSLPEGGGESSWGNFVDVMQSRNLIPERINMEGLAKIPDDAAAVAIVGPVYDFTPEEIATLNEYWIRPKAALLVTVSASETPPHLRTFLRNLGVTPRRDRVVTLKNGGVSTEVEGAFTEGMAYTHDFLDQKILFEGSTCSLEVRDKDAEDLNVHKITPLSLIEAGSSTWGPSGPTTWGETDYGKGVATFDPQSDNKPALSVAAAVIQGAANNDAYAGKVSKMVVIANSDFLDANNFSALHRDFLANSMDWMVGREDMVGFGPRSFGTYKLPLLDSQVTFINKVNLIFLPGIALLAGAFIWSSRRA